MQHQHSGIVSGVQGRRSQGYWGIQIADLFRALGRLTADISCKIFAVLQRPISLIFTMHQADEREQGFIERAIGALQQPAVAKFKRATAYLLRTGLHRAKLVLTGAMGLSQGAEQRLWKPSRRGLADGGPPASGNDTDISQLPITFLPGTAPGSARLRLTAMPPAAAAPGQQVACSPRANTV